MKKYIIIALLACMIGFSPAYSQDGGHVAISYDMSFGTGDLGDFISQGSFRGASIQYRYPVTDNILLGGDLGWNVFYEKKDFASYTSETQTLSGVQSRYVNMVPIIFSADYTFIPDNMVQPYIGLGIGTIYDERVVMMGTWIITENPWHFAVKAEAGALFEMPNGFTFKLGAKYYNAFETKDVANQGYFTISVGVAFTF